MRLVATLALLLAAATGAAALWESKEQAVQESAKLRPLLDSLMGPTAAQEPQELVSLFDTWAAAHGKEYAPGEKAARLPLFVDSLCTIVATNLDPASAIWLKPGPFADLSPKEFISSYLPKSLKPLHSAPTAAKQDLERDSSPAAHYAFPAPEAYPRHRRSEEERHKGPPKEVDWVEAGAVTPVKSQGKCGSCWAFTTAAALESKLLIEHLERQGRHKRQPDDPSPSSSYASYASSVSEPRANKQHRRRRPDHPASSVELSVEQIVDCVNKELGYASAGCGGGFPEEAFNYVMRFNITTAGTYPYHKDLNSTVTQACNQALLAATKRKEVLQIQEQPGSYQVLPDVEEIMWALADQPLATYYHVPIDNPATVDKFRHYGGGVWPASMCPVPNLPNWHDQCNHNMLVVGYSQGGGVGAKDSYFKIKNSWGEKWGSGGYLYSQMTQDDAGPCGMYRLNFAPMDIARPPKAVSFWRRPWTS